MTGTVSKTEALVLPEIGAPLVLSQVQLSTLQPDEAVVEMKATGICHTDILFINGTLPSFTPAVFGHEGAGLVLATGTRVSHVSPGDAVILGVNHCQQCQNCLEGHPNYCNEGTTRNFGGRRTTDQTTPLTQSTSDLGSVEVFSNFFGQSSFSRRAVVNGSCLVKVAQDASLKLFAPLGCGVSTGAGCVINTLKVKEGSSMAVFGVGTVGLSAVMAAKINKARYIIAVDLSEDRLSLAKRLGATHTVLSDTKEQTIPKIKQCVPGDGVNYAVDCTGVATVIETMLECLAPRGRAAQVGLPPPSQTISINGLQHLLRGQEYVGCAGGDCRLNDMIPFLIEQHRKGNFPLQEMVACYDYKDHARAFEDCRSGAAIKAVLVWS
ncbi:uncharacterized protein A1O9_08410 [Exophiala aquamarina CBS 119918]|uniref:Enoyl reductase (ER) domain-containing protein n=1 Tax=Exophiala aquamarina CBS 119918 TaxID=1182545 RepID=A0A072PJG0_9EURO|nr:uncharacterized protein A1O9_08410 [Exophiala aquamarina CBS 119918]KEF55660.1 hypothetical protein A1O9_08410 [Exophiala aquamarina CBS 119918]